MTITYINSTLFINIEDSINFTSIKKLKSRMYNIINKYSINDIVINILSNERYDTSLLDELINDYNSKYDGKLTIK